MGVRFAEGQQNGHGNRIGENGAMTALQLYGLKNCDTCKKAVAALKTAGRDVEFVDIRNDADLATKVPVLAGGVGCGPAGEQAVDDMAGTE